MSWINGSKDGHEKGFQDGKDGKQYNPVSTIGELANQVVRPESYTDTFVNGYREGWTEGNRKRNDV